MGLITNFYLHEEPQIIVSAGKNGTILLTDGAGRTLTKEDVIKALEAFSHLSPQKNTIVIDDRRPPLFKEEKMFPVTNPYSKLKSVGVLGDFPSKRTGPPITRDNVKIQNNDPCHCGSGKKFKNCCKK